MKYMYLYVCCVQLRRMYVSLVPQYPLGMVLLRIALFYLKTKDKVQTF